MQGCRIGATDLGNNLTGVISRFRMRIPRCALWAMRDWTRPVSRRGVMAKSRVKQ
jgi:hypothetical protein